MLDTEEQRAARAAAAPEEEITAFVHDPSPRVIEALLSNRGITEEHILIIAGRKNLPSETLESVFRVKQWSESYAVRLALARNPKTPLFTALSIARFLRLFDLAEIARNQVLPVLYRRRVSAIVIEKLPALAIGVKKTLAKVATGDILTALIQDGYPDVVRVCLDNPHLVEAGLYKVISRKTTSGGTIAAIADHRNWTCRYHIKFALIRNDRTPLAKTVLFLADLKTMDLKGLYRDPALPSTVRPHLHRELMERGIDPSQLPAMDDELCIEVEQNEIDDSDLLVRQFDEEARSEQQREAGGGENDTGDVVPAG